MSDLTTADLAGGTTPRTRESDAAVTTRDPKLDARDAEAPQPLPMPNRMDTNGDAREQAARPMQSSTSSMTERPSRLPNPAATDGAGNDADHDAALFPAGEAGGFRTRWTEVQTGFVDEPRHAVEQADSLVAEMMQRLAQVFSDERGTLEEQWSRGNDISTEDLRQALRRYRSFFDRLLSV